MAQDSRLGLRSRYHTHVHHRADFLFLCIRKTVLIRTTVSAKHVAIRVGQNLAQLFDNSRRVSTKWTYTTIGEPPLQHRVSAIKTYDHRADDGLDSQLLPVDQDKPAALFHRSEPKPHLRMVVKPGLPDRRATSNQRNLFGRHAFGRVSNGIRTRDIQNHNLCGSVRHRSRTSGK